MASVSEMHPIWVCSNRGRHGLRQISVNLLLSREVGRHSTWVTAHGFTNFLKMSSQCLCVFTLRFCSSESSRERISWALCLHCLFPVWLFGSPRGKRRCSRRPIEHKHWTMDDGRGEDFCSQIWGICVSAIQGQLNSWSVLHTYRHREDKSLVKTLSKWALPFPGELQSLRKAISGVKVTFVTQLFDSLG